MKKTNKKKKEEEDESYYAIIFIMGVILSLLIHWLLFSKLNLYPTIDAAIGIGIFAATSTILNVILKKVWNKK